MDWQAKVSPNWYMDLIYARCAKFLLEPVKGSPADLTDAQAPNLLQSALNQLDAFPTMLWRNGRPILENGRHAEVIH